MKSQQRQRVNPNVKTLLKQNDVRKTSDNTLKESERFQQSFEREEEQRVEIFCGRPDSGGFVE